MQSDVKTTQLRLSSAEYFASIVTDTLTKTQPGTPIRTVAEQIYAEQRYDFEPLFRQWVIARIVKLLSKREDAVDLEQMPLPGFEALPPRIRGERQKPVALLDATWSDLRQYRRNLLRPGRQKKVQQVERLMSILKEMPSGSTVRDAIRDGKVPWN